MTANPFREAALAMAHRGWHVFPLRQNSKRPAIKQWEHEATIDESQIHTWWAGASRQNIGIATGRASLVIIDLDTARGQQPPPNWVGARHGRDVLTALAHQAGEPFPDNTYTVDTPSGLHLYFQAPHTVKLRNTVAKVGWRVDTRAAGGYVVAAGSVRPEGIYRVQRSAPLAPLPNWLVTALTPAPPRTSPNDPVATDHHPTYLHAAVAGEAARVAAALDGSRRITLLRAASALGSLTELDDTTITAALTAAADHCRRHTSEPFPEHEVVNTIRDGIKFGREHPRRLAG